MSCTMFPLCCLTSISFQDLVWIWFQCIAWDWHDQAAMSRQTVGHQGVPKSTSIYPPGTHWLAPGPRYCLPSTRAHSTNNCAPAPPSKEPGARPVFQYLVSCQTPANLLLPTWVSNLGSNFSLFQLLCLELSIFTQTQCVRAPWYKNFWYTCAINVQCR